MTKPLRIKSAQDSYELTLEHPDERNYFLAELGGSTVTARIKIYENQYQQIANFFSNLAAHRAGWLGERTWESVESHLSLAATTDGRGHVYLRVTLEDMDAPSRGKAQAILLLEAGQLESIAKASKQTFGK